MKFVGAPLLTASAVLALSACISRTDAHSWLTKPVSRETDAYADVDNTVGCPSNTPGKSTSFKAGETIDVRYWRNNHLGGFIRWSMVPRGKESKANLDKSVFAYTCRESGPECVPKGKNTKYAGDGSGDNTISCGDKITLPDWLPAGDYVLQWTWFGVGSDYGNIGWAETQFRSCADIKLTTSGTKAVAPTCPVFVGGDRVTKLTNQDSDKCFYFYTTDIANTSFKGSNTDYEKYYKFGIPAAIEKCGGGASSGGNSTTPAPATTTKAPVPGKATKTPAPSTTTKAPKPASATKAPLTPAATTKAPVSGKTPQPATRTPAPTVDSGDDGNDSGDNNNSGENNGEDNSQVGGDGDDGGNDDSADGEATSAPAPATKVPGCKTKSAKY